MLEDVNPSGARLPKMPKLQGMLLARTALVCLLAVQALQGKQLISTHILCTSSSMWRGRVADEK